MKIRYSYCIAFYDVLAAAASFTLALFLRLGIEEFPTVYPILLQGTILFSAVCASTFWAFKLHRMVWRYISASTLLTIIKAVIVAITIFLLAQFLITRLEGIPRSFFFINAMLLSMMLIAPRLAYRLSLDQDWKTLLKPATQLKKTPVLLVGMGKNVDLFLRLTASQKNSQFHVVGIIDDNPQTQGHYIHNVKVWGSLETIEKAIKKLQIKNLAPQKLILSDNITDGQCIRDLLALSDEYGMTLARLPTLNQLEKPGSKPLHLRAIDVEDLLGRPQNTLDRDAMGALIANKRVLVTGSGGTIGGELTRQIASYGPSHLILAELSEFHLYTIEKEIRNHYPDVALTTYIADVRDEKRIETIFDATSPELVFHAAALKHVPIVEDNAIEGVRTNLMGTCHVANHALRKNCEAMVFISTDKAVNPTNIMGATKRLAEGYIQHKGESITETQQTKYITVRFGNVLGSSGSVIPLFKEQLEQGGPLTVTHPEMVRYFMTVREAVELVLQSTTIAKKLPNNQHNAVYVLDMGEPVHIKNLAEQMIRMAGLEPHKDIAITYTGLRPGEKLYEELFYNSEESTPTEHESIMQTYPLSVDATSFEQKLNTLLTACDAQDTSQVTEALQALVPEYTPSSTNEEEAQQQAQI